MTDTITPRVHPAARVSIEIATGERRRARARRRHSACRASSTSAPTAARRRSSGRRAPRPARPPRGERQRTQEDDERGEVGGKPRQRDQRDGHLRRITYCGAGRGRIAGSGIRRDAVSYRFRGREIARAQVEADPIGLLEKTAIAAATRRIVAAATSRNVTTKLIRAWQDVGRRRPRRRTGAARSHPSQWPAWSARRTPAGAAPLRAARVTTRSTRTMRRAGKERLHTLAVAVTRADPEDVGRQPDRRESRACDCERDGRST